MLQLKHLFVCAFVSCAILITPATADVTNNIIKSIVRNTTKDLTSRITPLPAPSTPSQKTKAQLDAESLHADIEHWVKITKSTLKNKVNGYPGIVKVELSGNEIILVSEIADSFAEFIDSAAKKNYNEADFKTIYSARVYNRRFEMCLAYSDDKFMSRAMKGGYKFKNNLFTINNRFVASIVISQESCGFSK